MSKIASEKEHTTNIITLNKMPFAILIPVKRGEDVMSYLVEDTVK